MARQGKERRFDLGNSRLTRRARAENEGLEISDVERLIYARGLGVDNYLTSKEHVSIFFQLQIFAYLNKKKEKSESSKKNTRSAVFSPREVYLLKIIILKFEIKVSCNLSTL